MAISLSQETHLITVTDDTVTIQNLLNAIRAWEAGQENMDCGQVAEAAGKQVLSETTQVGVTLKLLNWKITLGDRSSPVVCSVTDGNLVAVDGYGYPMSPIEPSTNVTVMVAQSSSATIGVTDIDDVRSDLAFIKQIESGRWKIESNQMIFYGADGEPLITFNLKDSQGNPTEMDAYERIPT